MAAIIELVDDDGEAVVEDPDDPSEPSEGRVPTKPMPPLQGGRIEIDLDNPEGVAEFLEMVTKILRKKRRIILIVE